MRAGRLDNRTNRHRAAAGSALILTVVLTSLLAIVGVLFLMVTRIDKMGTQAVSDNRELTFAVDTVVAQISELLAEDVPGVRANEEYYDYPDLFNAWLADLEPTVDVNDPTRYRWRQISSLTGSSVLKQNVLIQVIGDRDPIVDVNEAITNADADGDGVGDAQWFRVPGIMTSRGRPIYAAIRIVDNGAMLNVNSGYWFDPNRADPFFSNPNYVGRSEVDGSSPLQINAIALAGGHGLSSAQSQSIAATLLQARRIPLGDPNALSRYEQRVLWRYLAPEPNYTPFDLSDELELRYRGLLNHGRVDTRVENWGSFKAGMIRTPVDSGGNDLDAWFKRAHDVGVSDPNANYAYRHVATTYNMDRIIPPNPIEVGDGRVLNKRVNVNNADPDAIYAAVIAGLSRPGLDPLIARARAAQITANLLDYIDDDDEVTAIDGPSASGSRYYGLERPCIYISEIAHNAVTDAAGIVHHSYAIELHKPFFEDNDPNDDWRLVINSEGNEIIESIEWSGLRRFHVLLAEDPVAELFNDDDFDDPEEPTDTLTRYGYDRAQYSNPTPQALDPRGFGERATFSLERYVAATEEWLGVDFVGVVAEGWMTPDQGPHSAQRDITPNKCIRRLWTEPPVASETLGTGIDQFADPNDDTVIQAHPANRTLRNIGELGMVFAESSIGVRSGDTAEGVLLNLADAGYAGLFNYLTVIDPAEHAGLQAEETRIMGRINVNTAPWFVLAQLPWIQYQDVSTTRSERSRAIVDYRDLHGAYESIGELMQVSALYDLASDDGDNLNDEQPDRGPDLTFDTARDDLEERDLLFTRMSDLVTVRSDVFTAYILVRLGPNGPQKRMLAILDRSRTTEENPAVKVVALHPVADPR